MVSYMPRLFSRLRTTPLYQLFIMLSELQNRSGRLGDDRNVLAPPRIATRFLRWPVRSLVTIPIELYRFLYDYCYYNIIQTTTFTIGTVKICADASAIAAAADKG